MDENINCKKAACDNVDMNDGDKKRVPLAKKESKKNVEDLLFATVKDCLEKSQEMDKMRANVRSKVLNVVRGTGPMNKQPNENQSVKLLNQLIMEYLNWQEYKYTAEIFTAEASTTQDTMRGLLAKAINKENDFTLSLDEDMPILLEIVLKLMTINDK